MIRGLDDDEVGFLELVEQSKASVARQISLEEQREMKEFRFGLNIRKYNKILCSFSFLFLTFKEKESIRSKT